MTNLADIFPRRGCRVVWLLGMLATLLPSVALAETPDSATTVEGRWKSQDNMLVMDLYRCGNDFCGRLIQSENRCGPQILIATLDSSASDPDEYLILSGTFSVSAETLGGKFSVSADYGTYTVALIFRRKLSGDMRMIGGNRARPIFSRNMPINFHFARAGERQCTAESS